MSKNSQRYKCIRGKACAFGYPTSEGFTVLAGSLISEKVVPSFDCSSKSYYRLRNKLISDGVIVDRRFTENYTFTSPTAASAVVTGMAISWRTAWIQLTGPSEKEV